MILLYAHLVIAVLVLVISCLMSLDASRMFHELYPNVHIPKRNLAYKLETLIEIIIMAILPLFNGAMLLIMVFKSEEIKNRTIYSLYKKYSDKEDSE